MEAAKKSFLELYCNISFARKARELLSKFGGAFKRAEISPQMQPLTERVKIKIKNVQIGDADLRSCCIAAPLSASVQPGVGGASPIRLRVELAAKNSKESILVCPNVSSAHSEAPVPPSNEISLPALIPNENASVCNRLHWTKVRVAIQWRCR